MRLQISVDGMSHQIDSTDPELLGKWMVEIFGRLITGGLNQSSYVQVQAYPSFVPIDEPPGSRPDWIADTRIIGGTFQVRTPRELVAGLAAQLDEMEATGDDAT
ncbi:MAG TPA: hypothetical protein VGM87_08480 [Roseomonas sp.]|jgi:hypothetical protein